LADARGSPFFVRPYSTPRSLFHDPAFPSSPPHTDEQKLRRSQCIEGWEPLLFVTGQIPTRGLPLAGTMHLLKMCFRVRIPDTNTYLDTGRGPTLRKLVAAAAAKRAQHASGKIRALQPCLSRRRLASATTSIPVLTGGQLHAALCKAQSTDGVLNFTSGEARTRKRESR
jgi:hypothetical protein